MPVLNKQTGKWEDTPKEASKKAIKKALRDKNRGKAKDQYSQADKDEILLQMAKDLGYIE